MRIPITVTEKEFKELKKLYKGTKNNVLFVDLSETKKKENCKIS